MLIRLKSWKRKSIYSWTEKLKCGINDERYNGLRMEIGTHVFSIVNALKEDVGTA